LIRKLYKYCFDFLSYVEFDTIGDELICVVCETLDLLGVTGVKRRFRRSCTGNRGLDLKDKI